MALDLGRHHAARRDLQKYLELEPDAADRDAIRKQLQSIHLWLAQMS
jgi:regulator of sirC expression with transglutaminase-like and TPR domain